MPAQLLRIESTPDLVDRVYRTLLDAISDGSLAPGQRFTQEEIAAQLSVSRQPVLQALRLLKSDGFVLDANAGAAPGTRGRGLVVAPLDAAWMRSVYAVRGALDALAARLAAEQRFRMDPQLIEQGRKAARGRNVKAMVDADMAFHSAIYAASGNPLIEPSARLHWSHLRRVMGAVLQQARQREAVWDDHQAIADAIAAGHGDTAARLIEQHSREASDNLAMRLEHVLKQTQGDTP
ncbi:MAG: GntR family transcriptional regulator [Pseudomonadota bacterium]